jgi:hypothetical protein
MPAAATPFSIDDTESFEDNLARFLGSLAGDDAPLAAVLKSELPNFLKDQIDTAAIWDALDAAATASTPS